MLSNWISRLSYVNIIGRNCCQSAISSDTTFPHRLRAIPTRMASGDVSGAQKMVKLSPYIGTHDGTFHCDDVTACYMLKTLDRFKDHDIVRTRDPEKLAKAEIVVDVGGELDVDRLRLDHHQRTFNQTIKDYHPNLRVTNPQKPSRLSSSGLVYAIFGKDCITKQLNLGRTYEDLKDKDDARKMVDQIFEKAYLEFFEEIDAIDNGVDIASGEQVVYNYHINSGISSRVGRHNPHDMNATPEVRLANFKKAMEMVGAEIEEGIKFLGEIWWPKRQEFRQYVLKRHEFDQSGQIVHIDSDHLVSWKSALYELEEELGIVGEIKFIVFTDVNATTRWRATAVPVELKSFQSRVPFKEEWRGKRDEELQKASGVSDATFVHMSGFTGGALSLDGIKSLVRQTLGLQ